MVVHFSANFTVLPADKDTATEHCSVSLIANDRFVPSWEN